VIVLGLPFTVDTYASVIRPELTGLHRRAAEEVTSKGSSIQGAERYFLTEEMAILDREVRRVAYRLARKLEGDGYKAFHLPPGKADPRWLTAPFYHMPAASYTRNSDRAYGSPLSSPTRHCPTAVLWRKKSVLTVWIAWRLVRSRLSMARVGSKCSGVRLTAAVAPVKPFAPSESESCWGGERALKGLEISKAAGLRSSRYKEEGFG
jgi:hypothetical protein